MVETDASDYTLAAILLTYTEDGKLHPIAFHSHTFTSPELNYDVHDKELLAIFEAFTRWRHYLEGSGTLIDVITDHKNLEYTTPQVTFQAPAELRIRCAASYCRGSMLCLRGTCICICLNEAPPRENLYEKDKAIILIHFRLKNPFYVANTCS